MGSPCALHVYAPTRSEARAILALGRQEVDRLERKYSRYRPDSLASRINRSAGSPRGIDVDPETAALLDYAAVGYEQSGGLFDITSGILRQAWDFRSKRLPRAGEIEALLDRIGWWRIRWERPRLVLPLEGMELDFGGFVKEYAVDRVTALCREAGARHGLVDLGGDLGVIGPHPGGRPWRVGVRDPRSPERAVATVALAAGGLASSGDYERCMIVGGRRYGHILDPRSGWPVEGLAAVSVIAPHCLVAGTAATVAMLRGEVGGARWLEEIGLPHLRIARDGSLAGTLVRPGRRRASCGRQGRRRASVAGAETRTGS